MDLAGKKILLTGGAGFLGSAVMRELRARGIPDENISVPRSRTHDLRHRRVCQEVVAGHDAVIHLAAKVGGIGFNQAKPAELFYDNLIMGAELMEAARKAGVKKFVAIGTVCAYPKFAPVPFREDDLWQGYPEETNAPYGLAKKMLLVQAQAYRDQYGMNVIYLLPVNLYGPGDNFDPGSSHVIPALIKKFIEAQENNLPYVKVWGTGRATREFLYVDDAAKGIVKALEEYDGRDPVNLGSGREISIKDLANTIARLVGYRGEIHWDISKPDGQPRRKLDTSRAEKHFNFKAGTTFEDGLKKTIDWYLSKKNENGGPTYSI